MHSDPILGIKLTPTVDLSYRDVAGLHRRTGNLVSGSDSKLPNGRSDPLESRIGVSTRYIRALVCVLHFPPTRRQEQGAFHKCITRQALYVYHKTDTDMSTPQL